MLHAIEINNYDQRFTILLNVIKMLSARGFINENNITNTYDTVKDKFSDDQIYKINTDNGNNFAIKFILQKITTINKSLGINEFLEKFKDYNKIVIVTDINKKAYKQIVEYKNTEIFWHFEFMMNLIDHKYIPKHEILHEKYMINKDDLEEKYKNHEKFEDIYLVTKKECPKIEVTDPVARYYNLKPGQYIRIKRESISSGYAPSYRVVINSPISKLFERF